VQRIVVDANVLLSFIVDRDEKQRGAARALLQHAADGELVAIVPHFVIFEVVYVLQSTYRIAAADINPMIRDLIALPGLLLIDDCPWKRTLDSWPDPLSSLADAAIAAVALTNGYDAVATFDRKLARRLADFGVPAYW